MYTLAAVTPFATLFLLMVVWKKPAFIAAPLTLLISLFIVGVIWQTDAVSMLQAMIEGSLISIEIILIVFGAILLLNILKAADAFKPIEQLMTLLTPDKRIQAIMIAWFFVGFIEGAAGFGTPAMLAAPLLVMLGFKPLSAVALALVGDSAAVTFGAVGVPITIGIAEGISPEQMMLLGDSISQVSVTAALIHLLSGWMVPIFLAVITTVTHGSTIKRGLEIAPLAAVTGLCFLIPYFLSALWLSPEFPSMIGGLIGGLLAVIIIKAKLFQPKNVFDFQTAFIVSPKKKPDLFLILKAVSPYLLAVGLLAVTRVPLFNIGSKLQEVTIGPFAMFGLEINRSISPFYSPGFIFALTAVIAVIFFQLNREQIGSAVRLSLDKIAVPFLGLLSVLAIVQLLLVSGRNSLGLPSIPIFLAEGLPQTALFGPLLAPSVGVLGSFIAGSSTVSNLLFASFQAGLAGSLGLSLVVILALQASGSAIGNMIAVHNVLAAQATVGIKNKEGTIIRITLIPTLIYALSAGVIGLLLINLI